MNIFPTSNSNDFKVKILILLRYFQFFSCLNSKSIPETTFIEIFIYFWSILKKSTFMKIELFHSMQRFFPGIGLFLFHTHEAQWKVPHSRSFKEKYRTFDFKFFQKICGLELQWKFIFLWKDTWKYTFFWFRGFWDI